MVPFYFIGLFALAQSLFYLSYRHPPYRLRKLVHHLLLEHGKFHFLIHWIKLPLLEKPHVLLIICLHSRPKNWSDCRNTFPDPCCFGCNQNSGKCSGSRRFLRQQPRNLDNEPPLNVFVSPSSNPKPKKKITFDKNGDPPGVDRAAIYANMKSARAKWKGKAKGSYSFEYQRVCYECPSVTQGPFLIHVNRGKITKAIFLESGLEVPPDIFIGLHSIEELFDEIEKERNSAIDYFQVDYDISAGFPKRMAWSHFGEKGEKLQLSYIKYVGGI